MMETLSANTTRRMVRLLSEIVEQPDDTIMCRANATAVRHMLLDLALTDIAVEAAPMAIAAE
jgi:hypothetical protein